MSCPQWEACLAWHIGGRADAARRRSQRRRQGCLRLSVAAGGILDRFDVSLAAKGSDVRLLELSLQPRARSIGRRQHYRWNYERLLFGQPVRVDVLGIAPIDRLGELTWLGPISVIVFGLLVGLVVQAS